MTQPITPTEARQVRASSIPPEVFQAFNEAISDKIRGGYATVKQDDVVDRIVELMGERLHEEPNKRRAVRALQNMKGDDTYRARHAFANMTPRQMQEPHYASGRTRAQILAEYEAHDLKIDQAIAWVKSARL